MIDNLRACQVPTMPDLPIHEMRLIGAVRLSVLTNKTQHDVAEIMVRKLGSAQLANRLSILLAAIGDVWTDSFHVARPCCAHLTMDEALLVQIVRLAGTANRPAFDMLLREMLSEEERDMLFAVVGGFCQSWFQPPTIAKRLS